jgi:hypothetical protein
MKRCLFESEKEIAAFLLSQLHLSFITGSVQTDMLWLLRWEAAVGRSEAGGSPKECFSF